MKTTIISTTIKRLLHVNRVQVFAFMCAHTCSALRYRISKPI